ncbi:class I SAM-dependent methyltransferase [Rhodococcus sp. G-MC3]|uniref:class I SAM-dependent methyltransferase n=1 Tax=Rhodococcus sp. G-MC3 TaxID=3046209 RepID=UPI0024B97284|nr:class I SAM-dependent methyltransferase [Rhodococcus sp. G-MC3]MDJ0393817.1 class I SAM-dependent methyltransferase [Rhodococcus sp. G-MC3]
MFDATEYGRKFAEQYDSLYPPGPDVTAAVDSLAGLAPGGSILELGVGTGRLALALAERDVSVTGLDISVDMLARLDEKSEGRVTSVEADMTDFELGATFDIVVMFADSLYALPNQKLQKAAIERAVAHLTDNGLLIVDTTWPASIPDVPQGSPVSMNAVSETRLMVTASFTRKTDQMMLYAHTIIGPDGLEKINEPFRYVWPPELDLMAELAGAELVVRHSGWAEQPLGDAPARVISRYRKTRP